MASEELKDPARRELRTMNREIDLGSSLDDALERLERRLPGRELSVLVGTLVISQRSGGSLITALRQISSTLETRKELNREIRTQVTQASYTGYLVAGLGVGLVLLMNFIFPGLLQKLTDSVFGNIALIFAGACYAVGILLINRMTRIDA